MSEEEKVRYTIVVLTDNDNALISEGWDDVGCVDGWVKYYNKSDRSRTQFAIPSHRIKEVKYESMLRPKYDAWMANLVKTKEEAKE